MGSALYVYAIVGVDTPLPPTGTESGAARLALVRCRGLAAVTETVESERAGLTMDAVVRHEAIVEAVRRQGRSLPVRFGTVFRDAPSLTSALAEQYEGLLSDLHRVGDKVELSVTALWAMPAVGDDPSAGDSAGSRYMRARAAELRRDELLKVKARVVADQLDLVLGPLALERRMSLLPTPRVVMRTAYLLSPAALSAFRTAFDTIRGARGDLRLLLTGPWPPYSFVRHTSTDVRAGSEGRMAALGRLLTDALLEERPAEGPRREWTTSS